MPLLKHAKKKLRQDQKRTVERKKQKNVFRSLLKKAKQIGAPDAISQAVSSIDKAAKKHIIHPNKAARLKSSLAKSMSGTTPAHAAKKKTSGKETTKKTSVKKTAAKKSTTKASAKKAK